MPTERDGAATIHPAVRRCIDCRHFDRRAEACTMTWNGVPSRPSVKQLVGRVPIEPAIPRRTPDELRSHGWLTALILGTCGRAGHWWERRWSEPPSGRSGVRPPPSH